MDELLKASDLLANAVQKYGRGEINAGDLGQAHAFWETFRKEFLGRREHELLKAWMGECATD